MNDSGPKDVRIVVPAINADAVSHHPLLPAPAVGIEKDEMQVSTATYYSQRRR